jgi:effector-associated domain 1 (EAD1)-containing protein
MTMPSRRVPGASDDPYAERRARIQLCEVLAELIPDKDNISHIIARSGLRKGTIPMGASSVTRWTVVLDHAVDEGKMDALLHEVLTIYSGPELAAAVQHYKVTRES